MMRFLDYFGARSAASLVVLAVLTTCAKPGVYLPSPKAVPDVDLTDYPLKWQEVTQSSNCAQYRDKLSGLYQQHEGIQDHLLGTWLLCAIHVQDDVTTQTLITRLAGLGEKNGNWHQVMDWGRYLLAPDGEIPAMLPQVGGDTIAVAAIARVQHSTAAETQARLYKAYPHWQAWTKDSRDKMILFLSLGEKIGLAKRLVHKEQRDGAWDVLRQLWLNVDSTAHAIKEWWPDAMVSDYYWLADLAFSLRHYNISEQIASALYRENSNRGRALLLWGRSLARQKQGRQAEKIWLEHRRAIRSSIHWMQVTYRLGLLAEDYGRPKQAQGYFAAAAAEPHEHKERDHAGFRSGWLAYRAGDTKAAGQTWTREQRRELEIVNQRRIHYWSTKVTMDENDHFLAVGKDAPLSYYAWMAAGMRLAPLTNVVRWSNYVTTQTETPEPQIQDIRLLFDLGLLPAAQLEFSEQLQNLDSPAHRLRVLSYGDDLNVATLSLRQFWKYFEAEFRQSPPDYKRDLWEVVYPRPFREQILRAAAQQTVDPALLFAVMREESRFRPAVVSPAGAIGLLQLMPATAKRTAEEYHLPYDGSFSLSDPETNIPIAAAYLSKMLAHYDGNLVYTIASYNAGPNAVDRWRVRNKDLPLDVFVEEIPYSETRRYVAKVIRSYVRYKMIYDSPIGTVSDLQSMVVTTFD